MHEQEQVTYGLHDTLQVSIHHDGTIEYTPSHAVLRIVYNIYIMMETPSHAVLRIVYNFGSYRITPSDNAHLCKNYT